MIGCILHVMVSKLALPAIACNGRKSLLELHDKCRLQLLLRTLHGTCLSLVSVLSIMANRCYAQSERDIWLGRRGVHSLRCFAMLTSWALPTVV